MQRNGRKKEGDIGIFARLPESMAGRIVRQAKDAQFQINISQLTLEFVSD
jgi:hypothetical protein